MTATKLTAANCRTLKIARKLCNDKVYRHALEAGREGGEDAIFVYLQQFITSDIRAFLDDFATRNGL